MFRSLTGEDSDLADDSDASLSSKLGGTLTFDEPLTFPVNQAVAPSAIDSGNSSQVSDVEAMLDGHKIATGTRIVFEIVSARTVNNIRKKYVAYTLLIKRAPGLDRSPAVIERRYSDFLELFLNLKKNYPELMQSLTYFPKKTVLGNFKPEIITARSRAFEQFLYQIYGEDATRQSVELADFLYDREIREAHSLMQCGKFEDAIPLLENAYFLQEKVLGEKNLTTLNTLCEVIATHNAVDNITEAHKFAEIALKLFASGHHEASELYPPLVQLCTRLCWTLGKDKRDLEQKLTVLRQSGIQVHNLPTLLDIVMKKCK